MSSSMLWRCMWDSCFCKMNTHWGSSWIQYQWDTCPHTPCCKRYPLYKTCKNKSCNMSRMAICTTRICSANYQRSTHPDMLTHMCSSKSSGTFPMNRMCSWLMWLNIRSKRMNILGTKSTTDSMKRGIFLRMFWYLISTNKLIRKLSTKLMSFYRFHMETCILCIHHKPKHYLSHFYCKPHTFPYLSNHSHLCNHSCR